MHKAMTGGALIAVLAFGCTGSTDTWSLHSPSGERFAMATRSGGFAGFDSYDYSVVLGITASGEISDEPVFESHGCPPAYVFWRDDTHLEIFVNTMTPYCRRDIKVRKVDGVEAEIRPFTNSAKSAICP